MIHIHSVNDIWALLNGLQGKWRLGLYTYETHHVLSLNVKCTRIMTEMLTASTMVAPIVEPLGI